jgi:ubiquitin C-terminal hydrolase
MLYLDDRYLNDINTDNPLGMKGDLARAFAQLTKSLWSGYEASVAPSKIKVGS